ncbi:predicted protein [Coccidioides posadasii str. Silveira]|uniref:Predicted protein n=2 Tax=Coccidioides posadasii TaxID=199306 RepID=E9CRC2_COCPS|nr:predicted protein [Coccidioides posadasii str. Silveira]KMM64053.1 hypothetical protein CPAG_00405 [Coccidioides posadasii RMSCC 3488]
MSPVLLVSSQKTRLFSNDYVEDCFGVGVNKRLGVRATSEVSTRPTESQTRLVEGMGPRLIVSSALQGHPRPPPPPRREQFQAANWLVLFRGNDPLRDGAQTAAVIL